MGQQLFLITTVIQRYYIGYDPDATKHVIVYKDQDVTNDPGTAIEGTVSGTSISFGTAIIYQATAPPY